MANSSKRPPWCQCPAVSGIKNSKLISHTLACLRKQRGGEPIDTFYSGSRASAAPPRKQRRYTAA
jgi:hypothetical protein